MPQSEECDGQLGGANDSGLPHIAVGLGSPFLSVASFVRPSLWTAQSLVPELCGRDGIVKKATGWDYWRDSLQAGRLSGGNENDEADDAARQHP